MKKLVLSIVLAVSAYSININAQVGVGTVNPSSTLDVTAKNETGTSQNVDGLLIPRVDRERAQSMTGVPTSTLIYVNNISTGALNGTAINIDAVGYYYFNGTAWVKLSAGSGADINIYKDNGTLTGDRIVTQQDKTLSFTGTAANAFSVDGNTFSVDAANHRIGIGTIAPQGIGHIVSDNKGSGAGNDFYFDGFGSSGNPAIFFGSAGGTPAAPTALSNGTKVGSIYFNARLTSGWAYTSAGISSTYKGDGTTNLSDVRFMTSGGERAIIDETGKMGIGTISPTKTLDVAGEARIRTMNMVSGASAVNPVYVDSNGVLVKAPTISTYGSVTSNTTANITPGATGTLITGLVDNGRYKIMVLSGDACADGASAEYFVHNNTFNNYYSINGIGGILSSGTTNKSPTFTSTTRNVVATTWTGKTTCQAGDDSTALNYTLSMNSSGVINITNNGNITRYYVVIATRFY